MRIAQAFGGVMTALIAAFWANIAIAQDNIQGLERVGKPIQDGMGFQPAATDLMRDIHWFDNFLNYYIGVIVIIVMGLLLFVILRFSAKANPTPATFTHNTPLEVAWIVLPAISLVIIALTLSLPILFKQLQIPEADLRIKATGNQWYWSYEYQDHEFEFDSIMLEEDELADYGYMADEYMLATDTAIVIPVGKTVVMQITGADVIHAWTIPSFGVKQDAVPGRLAELWFKAEREGLYFGQCSELCGKDHTYMPITVKVVSQEVYDEWLTGAVEEFAGDPSTLPNRVQVASAN